MYTKIGGEKLRQVLFEEIEGHDCTHELKAYIKGEEFDLELRVRIRGLNHMGGLEAAIENVCWRWGEKSRIGGEALKRRPEA